MIKSSITTDNSKYEVDFASDNYYCVYIHRRPNGEPFYVGKGTLKRAYNLAKSKRNKHHAAIVAKYGSENIIVDVFPCIDEFYAFRLEETHISICRSLGYEIANYTNGGEGTSGRILTNETKRILSEKNKLWVRSDDIRKKMSEGRKGMKLSEKHKINIGIGQLGKTMSEEAKIKIGIGNKGKKRTPEQLKQMSESRKGKIPSEETREKLRIAQKVRREREALLKNAN